jgi:multicomponent Na+:H+ antiporter subunit E
MAEPTGSRPLRAALLRGTGLFGLWILLAAQTATGSGVALVVDATVGLFAAGVAAWVSLRLLPPRAQRRLRWTALARLVAGFLWQSVVAGIDVARRAFSPRLPLRPGFLIYRSQIPPGPGRAAFGALTSLVPGTLPVGTDADGAMVYHCLDQDQPIAAGLAKEERLLLRIWSGELQDD